MFLARCPWKTSLGVTVSASAPWDEVDGPGKPPQEPLSSWNNTWLGLGQPSGKAQKQLTTLPTLLIKLNLKVHWFKSEAANAKDFFKFISFCIYIFARSSPFINASLMNIENILGRKYLLAVAMHQRLGWWLFFKELGGVTCKFKYKCI